MKFRDEIPIWKKFIVVVMCGIIMSLEFLFEKISWSQIFTTFMQRHRNNNNFMISENSTSFRYPHAFLLSDYFVKYSSHMRFHFKFFSFLNISYTRKVNFSLNIYLFPCRYYYYYCWKNSTSWLFVIKYLRHSIWRCHNSIDVWMLNPKSS